MAFLRNSVGADARAMANLHGECFQEGRWDEVQMAGSLALPTTKGWVAEDEQGLVGFLLAQFVADEAEILTFCVRAKARRGGIGRLLLQKLIEEAPPDGLFLEVAQDNIPALSLYEAVGFVQSGRRVGYYARQGQAVDAIAYSYKSKG